MVGANPSNGFGVASLDANNHQYVKQGASSTGTHSSITVDDTSTGVVLLAANSARNGARVTNNGTNSIWIGLGDVAAGDAAAATGGLLLATGDTWTIERYSGAIKAFAKTAASSVAGVMEW